MGPRTRNLSSRNSTLTPPPAPELLSPSQLSRESTVSSRGPSPRYSGPSSVEPPPPPPDSKNLGAIAEREYGGPPAPEAGSPPPPHDSEEASQEIQEVPEEPLNVVSVPKVANLTPPPQIKFDSVPVKWKGLPLEAALWTFNSKELQELVSRAIRGSSRESFIRVLSVENLEERLPEELERLNALKAMTQSKWRFSVHRRTMLLQALHSHSLSGYNDKDGAALVAKLSETTAECDQLLEDLLQIADQVAQINHLVDQHWASALAIALRKLNSSYGRRTSELLKSRAKVASLEAELNDAWQQAEKLAREMDDLDAEVNSDAEEDQDLGDATLDLGDAVIEVAEVISLNHRKSPSASSQVASIVSLSHRKSPSGASSSRLSIYPVKETLSLDAVSRMHSEQSATTSGTEYTQATTPPSPSLTKLPTPTPSEMEYLLDPTTPSSTLGVDNMLETPQLEHLIIGAALPSSPSTNPSSAVDPSPSTAHTDNTDAVSIRSTRSVRSTRSGKSARTARSQRTTDASRVSSVSAARRRSQRTSMSSLRMPNITRKPAQPPVPVPALPLPSSPRLSPGIAPDRRASTIESFLDFAPSDSDDEEAEVGTVSGVVVASPRRTSIDDIEVVARSAAIADFRGTQDDITVMPRRSAAEAELVAPRRSQFSLDHQHPFANEEPVAQSIPSIWLLQDTPKTPAERVESMMRNHSGTVKMGSFQRLKSLTKRYSLPFPGVVARSKPGRNATAGT
ncbi:hypothetical protein R3P38DRAFT_3187250 [Favolaschia claudopus]|uniref:Uncharacterized protein n=1 Tax=Favolaschia claudopus TaxID=2862362 RepID=A0AAW0BYL3_9AGAR